MQIENDGGVSVNNKLLKNLVFGVVLLIAVLIVKKLWLPDGILGIFK
ncbi:hypothetical protein DFP94_10842 [Fontibacillus phaseoli]|uniref:Uncharacterized protein n=1 Tax=Fontibacillus phaseoli TaxID=1416533 RepID=A0A369B833_9BACL|nr:hypothetical protein [Fontibacillus phaseoli]RCX17683.1 hypothetical protein DFP94_10842 [Fontibacillus phaseoli]